MRRNRILFLSLFVLVFISGCGRPDQNDYPASARFMIENQQEVYDNRYFMIVTDTETDCKYLFVQGDRNGSAITPLLDNTGAITCK